MFSQEPRHLRPRDHEYPKLLTKISDAPKQLWVRGPGINNDLFHLASIGSREVDADTLKHLAIFLTDVCLAYENAAQSPIVIVSGLALGVDAKSHEVALQNTHTVGVLPSPINRMYPKENIELARAMIEVGRPGTAIVSEYGPIPDGQYKKIEPLRRNRITAGMSNALLVSGVSELRSGSMSTVGRATKERRPIFFLKDTLSPKIREIMLGVHHAQEVSDAQQFVDQLLELK